ncbi:hypothetical protein K1T71_012053 [Dendrolimus kikuchii]|uniref:Uncharacterized protein n=1 Tax=Dendrolimus kikuchii TaxID=765133 RepID=A0ACC1CKI5_9NEOP|nr:hypothetical protein K1T71_012053 [Dendrolimus kikuchii]
MRRTIGTSLLYAYLSMASKHSCAAQVVCGMRGGGGRGGCDGRGRCGEVFEDAELEVLLDQDSCPTQQELAGSLGVTQQAISKRLKVMGMIQKQGSWVPYELKPIDVERRLFACEQMLVGQRRKGFLHRIVTGDEKWAHYDNPKRRKSWGYPPAMLRRRRPNRIFTVPRSCSVFGGTSSA